MAATPTGSRRQGVEHAFLTEDAPVLENIQSMIGDADFWSLHPVVLKNDGGAVLARRRLDKVSKEEQSTQV